MKTKYLLLILIPVLLTSCYSTRLTPEYFSQPSVNGELFTLLDFSVDENSLMSYFPQQQTIIEEEDQDTGKPKQIKINRVVTNYEVNDLRNLLENYMAPPNFRSSDSTLGDIEFVLSFLDFRKNVFLPAFSTLSFGIFNLLGLPTGSYAYQIELKASVYDLSGNRICTFRGLGSDKYLTGVYYHNGDEKRPSFIRAAKNALGSIDDQLAASRQQITAVLRDQPR